MTNTEEDAALKKALFFNDVSAVEELIIGGRDPSGTFACWSGVSWPLLDAVLGRQYEMAEMLIRHGVDPHAAPRYKGSAFTVAVYFNMTKMIKLFLRDRDEDVFMKLYGVDSLAALRTRLRTRRDGVKVVHPL